MTRPRELSADWHAVNDAVLAYGQALLDADAARVGDVEALGVDEVLFARVGRWRTQAWSTSIVDVTTGQLLDVIAGRSPTKAPERLDDKGSAKLLGLLEAGDPRGEVRTARHSKEVVRSIYDIDDPDLAETFVAQLGHDLQDDDCPPEVRQLGRTLIRWHAQITAWHRARVSNGPTEGANQPDQAGQARIRSGSAASATTAYASCSTPATRTGTASPPSPRSHPRELRSAFKPPLTSVHGVKSWD